MLASTSHFEQIYPLFYRHLCACKRGFCPRGHTAPDVALARLKAAPGFETDPTYSDIQ